MKQTLIAFLMLLAAAPLAAQKKTKVNFEKQIFPIFKKYCVECHQATYVDKNGRRRRPKGRVMLDTLANIKKSKKGKLFDGKTADESILMETILLPADDEDRMPPPKKGPPLKKKDIDLIRRWIEEGQDYGKWTGEKKSSTKDKKTGKDDKKKPTTGTGSSKTGSSKTKKKGPSPLVTLSKSLRPVAAATLAKFEDTPFKVCSVGDDNPLLSVSCAGHTDDVDDSAVQQLLAVKDHVTDLDLSRSQVSDACCAVIAKMPRLTKLDLRQTDVGNQGAKLLSNCTELRSLNLFDTKTGDYALATFTNLKNLEQLYVWQTDVSARAVVKLREQLKGTRIVFNADLPDPAEATADSNKRRRR